MSRVGVGEKEVKTKKGKIMNVMKMSEQKSSEIFLRAVLYGEAGSGKTHLLREFPKPMLVFDFDQKYDPLIGVEGIDVVSYTVNSGSAMEYKELKQKFWADWREATKSEYATIVIDSLTNLDGFLLKAFMCEAGKKPDDKLTLPIFGDLRGFYQTLFNSARSLSQSKHVIILAHEKLHTNDEGGTIAVKPLVTGSMKDELSSLFKDTWYLEYDKVGKKERRTLHYQKYKLRTCASTTLRGEGRIENPTFEKIKQEILKGRNTNG
jgi:hypothetical protein